MRVHLTTEKSCGNRWRRETCNLSDGAIAAEVEDVLMSTVGLVTVNSHGMGVRAVAKLLERHLMVGIHTAW